MNKEELLTKAGQEFKEAMASIRKMSSQERTPKNILPVLQKAAAAKLMIPPTQETSIRNLVIMSIQCQAGQKPGQIQKYDCHQTSLLAQKKVLFLMSVEKELGIVLETQEAADIEDLRELSEVAASRLNQAQGGRRGQVEITWQAKGVRKDFPIFQRREQTLVYLDNGATTQKPGQVISRMSQYYASENANIHRGLYPLSSQAEELYESARDTVRAWIGAESGDEIIFTKGCTESVNMAASGLFESWIKKGDNVIVTELEHLANFLPWKRQQEKKGADLRIATCGRDGALDAEAVLGLMDKDTRLIAITAMSNVTGFRPDLARIVEEAHKNGTLVLVDGAQEIAHHRLSVSGLGCDFLCFSGHKVYGPMGIGVLYGKRHCLEIMEPFLYGGGMGGKEAWRYEAGTQNIGGALGLAEAFRYLEKNDFEKLACHERELSVYLKKRLKKIPGIHLVGPDIDSPILSFESSVCGSYDLGAFLAARGIAVRCGVHCAWPLMERLGRESVCRISLGIYNTREEMDYVADCLEEIQGKTPPDA